MGMGLGLVAVVTGCTPVAMVQRYGIDAVLVDRQSGEPASRMPVRVSIDDDAVTRTTGHDGSLRRSPEWDWHLSWLGGPAYSSDPEARIEIVASGFVPERITWRRYREDERFVEVDGVIHLGTIQLQPHAGD